jgi:hypothetical protein
MDLKKNAKLKKVLYLLNKLQVKMWGDLLGR